MARLSASEGRVAAHGFSRGIQGVCELVHTLGGLGHPEITRGSLIPTLWVSHRSFGDMGGGRLHTSPRERDTGPDGRLFFWGPPPGARALAAGAQIQMPQAACRRAGSAASRSGLGRHPAGSTDSVQRRASVETHAIVFLRYTVALTRHDSTTPGRVHLRPHDSHAHCSQASTRPPSS